MSTGGSGCTLVFVAGVLTVNSNILKTYIFQNDQLALLSHLWFLRGGKLIFGGGGNAQKDTMR